MGKIIKPGDPDFNIPKDIQIGGEADLLIQAEDIALNDRAVMTIFTVDLTDVYSKLVIWVTPLSRPEMLRLGEALFVWVNQLNIPESYAEASVSPTKPKQYDFMLFNIPTFQADPLKSYFTRKVIGLFSNGS